MSMQPLYFECLDVGKNIKSTKKQYVWRFTLSGDTKEHCVELYNSQISGKKKIIWNRKILYDDNIFKGAFQFTFKIHNNMLTIQQHGDKYELRVNNQAFSHLWDRERTKQNFDWGSKDKNDAFQEKDYSKAGYAQKKPEPVQSHSHGGAGGGDDSEEEYMKEQIKKIEEMERREARQKNKEHSKPSQGKHRQEEQKVDVKSGFSHGFEQLASYDASQADQQQDQQQPSSGIEFNFESDTKDIPQGQPVQNKSNEPDSIMDLLGGGSSTTTTTQQQPQQNNGGGFDFFGTSSQPQQNQQQQQVANDPFSGNSVPLADQQKKEEAEQNKPKFVPNIGFLTNQQPQQNMMMNNMQMAMQQQVQMQMMQQQQQQQMFGGGGMQQPNQFMTQPGQQNQFGMMQQQQPMGGGGQQFNQFGTNPQQQQQMMGGGNPGGFQTNQQQNQGSSPFDMFS